MKIARTKNELRDLLKKAAGSVGLVPTMGALHDGHLSLIARARADNDIVVLSIFVNPLQFGPSEDFAHYPRDEVRDLSLARSENVDIVFAPTSSEMYPPGSVIGVKVGGDLGTVLEGAERPGHFDGVATVVIKLLNLVQPERAYFGAKDAQQVAVVRRLVDELNVPTQIVVCPTVRDERGLALSSRNALMDMRETEKALALSRSLGAGRAALENGQDINTVEKEMRQVLEEAEGVEPGYAKAVDPHTFGTPTGDEVLLVVSGRVGKTRLIDNLLVEGD